MSPSNRHSNYVLDINQLYCRLLTLLICKVTAGGLWLCKSKLHSADGQRKWLSNSSVQCTYRFCRRLCGEQELETITYRGQRIKQFSYLNFTHLFPKLTKEMKLRVNKRRKKKQNETVSRWIQCRFVVHNYNATF